MLEAQSGRFRFSELEKPFSPEQLKEILIDYGCRRYLSYSLDFDNRVFIFSEYSPGPSEEARRLAIENVERVKRELLSEYGLDDSERKLKDFIAIGSKPFSIISYHNQLFDQVRHSFVIGAYYPALVAACALGERILNHLVLDLRDYYKSSPEYKKVSRKRSFDNWDLCINTLSTWGLLSPECQAEFRELMALRHRSIHFNPETYGNLRADALAAVLHVRRVIELQFSTFGDRPWFIKGTAGHLFIKREWEANPFIKRYFLPVCPLVGPYFSISFEPHLKIMDHDYYGGDDWSDEEFAALYQDRNAGQLAKEG